MGFSPEDLEALIHLLSGKAASSLERDTLLEELSHWFQAALTRPPLNFETLITSLSDRNLQWLLQWMLSQHIVSVDMLAAYIWSLEEKGKRLVDNLSQSIRHHVVELMAAYRRERSYRWADEVRYLIHHNLFRHSGPLVSHIAILRTYSDLRRQQTAEDLVRFLQGADHWHASLSHLPRSLRERYASLIPSRFIAAYGSFVPEEVFLSWWHDVISKRGLAILREDRLWWISQPMEKRAFEAMEFLKQWFLLEAKEIIRQEEVPLVLSTLTSSWQIEIITYEIGVAACLYAIKPFETPTDLLPPILCHLLEDIRSKTLTFHNWGDYRIPESQEAFLKAIYVLRRLGRL
ncbi:MAG: hypothetical protein N2314_06465 [Brevinematales bacterium]|nr:hypothetical protein [Brevinematales bacterium]